MLVIMYFSPSSCFSFLLRSKYYRISISQYAASHWVRYRFSTCHNYLAEFSSPFPYDETVNFHECHVTREILVGLGSAVSCICISYSSWTTARSFIMWLLHVQRRCQNHPLKRTSSGFPRRWSSLESSGFWRLPTQLPLFRRNTLSPLSTTKR